eukprot:8094726-Pyramimonas_sp.AAC.3
MLTGGGFMLAGGGFMLAGGTKGRLEGFCARIRGGEVEGRTSLALGVLRTMYARVTNASAGNNCKVIPCPHTTPNRTIDAISIDVF